MKLLIDTNVILNLIFHRVGCEDSACLFRKAEQEGSDAFITASIATDLFYIIRKETQDTERTYQIMENILKLTKVLSVTDQDVKEAFGEKWKDFEDCVQYTVAVNNRMDCIITENRQDYVNSSIPVMSPQEYLKI